ncbi:MAG: hypothetical protein ACTSUU_06935 [Candidatus Thorarchaeota archaeon]
MDFEHLKKLEVKAGETAPFTFYQIVGEPVLHLAPATEANKPYFNALLKRSRKNQRRLQGGNFTATVIAENRDDDRELYPRHIVKGWDQVVDSDGESVPFSKEACADFLTALPDWLFDEARQFAVDASNYVDVEADVEELAGNSQEG